MRAWYRARRKERGARKAQGALDRLHGRHAQPRRRRDILGGMGDGFGDGLADFIGDVLGGLFAAIFKFFD